MMSCTNDTLRCSFSDLWSLLFLSIIVVLLLLLLLCSFISFLCDLWYFCHWWMMHPQSLEKFPSNMAGTTTYSHQSMHKTTSNVNQPVLQHNNAFSTEFHSFIVCSPSPYQNILYPNPNPINLSSIFPSWCIF